MSEGMADEAVALISSVRGTVLDIGPGSGGTDFLRSRF